GDACLGHRSAAAPDGERERAEHRDRQCAQPRHAFVYISERSAVQYVGSRTTMLSATSSDRISDFACDDDRKNRMPGGSTHGSTRKPYVIKRATAARPAAASANVMWCAAAHSPSTKRGARIVFCCSSAR